MINWLTYIYKDTQAYVLVPCYYRFAFHFFGVKACSFSFSVPALFAKWVFVYSIMQPVWLVMWRKTENDRFRSYDKGRIKLSWALVIFWRSWSVWLMQASTLCKQTIDLIIQRGCSSQLRGVSSTFWESLRRFEKIFGILKNFFSRVFGPYSCGDANDGHS